MNEDLLMTWKDIAAYLKCSVRKAQRLERQQLPVKRLPNTKAVWASKTEIDQWLNRQSAHVLENAERRSDPPPFRFPGQVWILATGFLLTVTAAIFTAYALTILLFLIEATLVVLSYSRLPDSVYTRAFVGTFLIAGLSYAIAATSLPGVLSGAVNMSTLPPAFAYPFVIGLRFIPIPALLCISFIVAKHRNLGAFDRSRRMRVTYVVAGAFLSGVTAIAGFSRISAIWQEDLPIRWTILTGEIFIGTVNLALLALGYTFFGSPRADAFYRFTAQCGIACLLIALTAAINSRHWMEVGRFHLDVLHPETFTVRNPEAVSDFQRWVAGHNGEAGNDLVALSRDPEFLDALKNGKFYKQTFDERFQVSHRAVIFGLRDAPNSRLRQPQFLLIRFPAELAALLRFEPTH